MSDCSVSYSLIRVDIDILERKTTTTLPRKRSLFKKSPKLFSEIQQFFLNTPYSKDFIRTYNKVPEQDRNAFCDRFLAAHNETERADDHSLKIMNWLNDIEEILIVLPGQRLDYTLPFQQFSELRKAVTTGIDSTLFIDTRLNSTSENIDEIAEVDEMNELSETVEETFENADNLSETAENAEIEEVVKNSETIVEIEENVETAENDKIAEVDKTGSNTIINRGEKPTSIFAKKKKQNHHKKRKKR